MRIWDDCRQIIREDEQGLSTGAYGDEGKIILELMETLVDVIRDEDPRHYDIAVAWASNVDVEELRPATRDAIRYLTSTIAARTEPMRLTMSPKALEDAKTELFHRLDEFGAEPHALLKKIFERYFRVIENRDAVQMVRGGDEWRLLHRYDLLACLGPWIIEVDEMEEEAAEEVA